jgi:hypothetical protein
VQNHPEFSRTGGAQHRLCAEGALSSLSWLSNAKSHFALSRKTMLSPKPPLVEAPGGTNEKEKAYEEESYSRDRWVASVDNYGVSPGFGERWCTLAPVLLPRLHMFKMSPFVSPVGRCKPACPPTGQFAYAVGKTKKEKAYEEGSYAHSCWATSIDNDGFDPGFGRRRGTSASVLLSRLHLFEVRLLFFSWAAR